MRGVATFLRLFPDVGWVGISGCPHPSARRCVFEFIFHNSTDVLVVKGLSELGFLGFGWDSWDCGLVVGFHCLRRDGADRGREMSVWSRTCRSVGAVVMTMAWSWTICHRMVARAAARVLPMASWDPTATNL